jgi:hypothetical protein
VAFIYMSCGAVLQVNESRNDVLRHLESAESMVEFVVQFSAGQALSPETVSINPRLVAVVSDRELP